MTPLRAWIAAVRPATLLAAIAPVAVGTACAHATLGARPGAAALCLAGALLLQITANLVNDVADFARGADTGRRLGPARAVAAGWLTAEQVRRGAGIALGLAVLCGAALFSIAGWVIIPLWIASITAAVLYTAGPRPLGYLGLGDVTVFVFFGPAGVVGTTFVQTGRAPLLAWAAALPVGALATAILVVNNLRDRDGDAAADKRTLAVRFGERGARAQFQALVGLAIAVPPALALAFRAPWLLLPLLCAPLAIGPVARMRRSDGAALNPALAATARLLLAFGLLLATGIALGAPT